MHRSTRTNIGAIFTTREVALGVMTIILFAEGPPTLEKPTTFWEILRRWQRTWMWENLQWVGDDHWIAEAIEDSTLIAITDGSYMKDLYPNIHLAVLFWNAQRAMAGYGAPSQRPQK